MLTFCKNARTALWKMRWAGRRLLGRRGLGCRMPLHLRERAISRKVAKWG